ncbi:hypothetical protein ACH4E8_03190 [Streptomyces sp. NPDC017979]|uniref:hypothetical protein n=1 Tax=Streptomyces sp. NPDC017979 TaxID=3365024 RepID=UPI00379C8E05
MSTRHGAKTRRGVPAALVAVALTFSLAACGGGGDGDDGKNAKDAPKASTPADGSGDGPKDGGSAEPQSSEPLATINGSNGFQITIRTAERDSGGFLTVEGVLKNTSGKSQFPPLQWNGQETKVSQTGPSFAGMTLVDKTGKKRYYVLRDTDGYPLTTTGLTTMQSGQSIDFFAQFPAPPEGTKSVDVQIPLMPTVTIGLS